MDNGKVGVIGGSGLYAMAALENVREVEVTTPFGPPSDVYIVGTLYGHDMVFLPRTVGAIVCHRQPLIFGPISMASSPSGWNGSLL